MFCKSNLVSKHPENIGFSEKPSLNKVLKKQSGSLLKLQSAIYNARFIGISIEKVKYKMLLTAYDYIL